VAGRSENPPDRTDLITKRRTKAEQMRQMSQNEGRGERRGEICSIPTADIALKEKALLRIAVI
jgi:hypothetical protein